MYSARTVSTMRVGPSTGSAKAMAGLAGQQQLPAAASSHQPAVKLHPRAEAFLLGQLNLQLLRDERSGDGDGGSGRA